MQINEECVVIQKKWWKKNNKRDRSYAAVCTSSAIQSKCWKDAKYRY